MEGLAWAANWTDNLVDLEVAPADTSQERNPGASVFRLNLLKAKSGHELAENINYSSYFNLHDLSLF